MVNNYAFMKPTGFKTTGIITTYDYYHSGGDGIAWDCIQILNLDETGQPILKNDSPIWKYSKDVVDESYILMIEAFLKLEKDKLWGWDQIERAHERVLEYENRNRNTSKVRQH
jgi:hypothetical protein